MLKEELSRHGIIIGRDGFYELLKKHNLLIRPRKQYAITDSNHPNHKWSDLIKDITLTATEQLWVSDITYLQTENGFVYLSLIIDAYSKRS